MQTYEKTEKNKAPTTSGVITSIKRSNFDARRKAKLELAKQAKKKRVETPNKVDYQPTGGGGLLYNPTLR